MRDDADRRAGERCELCGRRVESGVVTRHHLLPRSRARKLKKQPKRNRRRNPQETERTVALCRPCHRNVHASIDNKELERDYDNLQALASHPAVRRFTEWVKDKPHGRL